MPVNCMQRTNSATVLQSLALLNSEFLFDQAERMASRLTVSAGADRRRGRRAGVSARAWLASPRMLN